MADFDCGLVWFRRDLRIDDHAALYHALTRCRRVMCAFVFDPAILAPLPEHDRRVAFIHACLSELESALREAGGALLVRHGEPSAAVPALAAQCGAQAVFTNHDYEPAAQARDAAVGRRLAAAGVAFLSFQDQVIFETDQILSAQRKPYSVFTPYKRAWLAALTPAALAPYATAEHLHALGKPGAKVERGIPSLAELGFGPARPPALPAGTRGALALFDDFQDRMDRYDRTRDFPAVKGPSYLSVHLRHGTLSIRALARVAHEAQRHGSPGAQTWLSELIWRDFYFSILAHFPEVGMPGAHRAFHPEYDRIQWAEGAAAEADFAAWCAGCTGFPLVDAGMRQLNQSGYMHNRLRMVTASFLSKDLGIDWRRGEAYFAALLNDFDLAANNGGWQWAASSGCDAQPYFRIFNPVLQSEKFDPLGKFIRHYVPELAGLPDPFLHAPWLATPQALNAAGVVLGETYPRPIVDHGAARQRTLARYAVVKEWRKSGVAD